MAEPVALRPEELRDVRRVVLIWIGRLGDFLIATPLIRSVRARFPEAEITMIVGEKGREAAELCPGIDRILELKRFTSPLSNLRLSAQLARRPADLLIDLNSAYSRASAALARLAKARAKVSFEKAAGNGAYTFLLPAPAETEHMLDRYGRVAEALGAPYDPTPRVAIPQKDLAAARKLLAEFGRAHAAPAPAEARRGRPGSAIDSAPSAGLLIGVHPGNFKKVENRWPEAKFAELSDRLLGRGGVRLLYLAGPGEEREVARIVSRLTVRVPVAPPLPLSTSAALLSLLDLLIVNVTGTAHLAAAVGTPTFTFRSRYTQAVWMPRSGPNYGVVDDSWESCRDIPVEAAWAALDGVLEGLARRAPARE